MRMMLSDPDGNTTTYGYANTATNKGLASVTHAMPGYPYGTGLGVFSYERDSQGRLSELLRGYTHRQKWLYDSHGRLSGTRVYVSESTPLHEENYAYDPLDRRSRVDYPAQHGGAGASSVATRREWGYDAAGRLAREERFPSASGTTADWGRTWGYGGAGNRHVAGRYDGSTTVTPNTGAVFNAWNQRTDFWNPGQGEDQDYFDDEGNLVGRLNSEQVLEWDRGNRLREIEGYLADSNWGTVTYGYDTSGRLINRTGADGTKEKRYYADGLSPILVKRWDPALNSGAGAWKTVRTAAHLPGVIGHVAAEREPSAWNSNGSVDYTASFTDRQLPLCPPGEHGVGDRADRDGVGTNRYGGLRRDGAGKQRGRDLGGAADQCILGRSGQRTAGGPEPPAPDDEGDRPRHRPEVVRREVVRPCDGELVEPGAAGPGRTEFVFSKSLRAHRIY
jgi:hypothetical protein